VLALELELAGAGRAHVAEDRVQAVVERVLADVGVVGAAAVGVAFVGEARMRALNRVHRGRDAVTDVLSFPIDGLDPLPDGLPRQLGDVAICTRQAARQAATAGVEVGDELTGLLVHGLLHLVGFDHEADDGDMFRRQDALCADLPPLIGGAR
jgi:probable rRNA maturation factor